VTSTDILTFFRTQSFERLARLVITISADDDKIIHKNKKRAFTPFRS
jgi:hypothetical protein